jgi:hypothetical protein
MDHEAMKQRVDRLCELWLEHGLAKHGDRYREFCELIEQLDMLRRGIEPIGMPTRADA